MGFGDLLQHVGDTGKFQIFMIILGSFLNMQLSPHDFMDNFVAAIPAHHCYVSLLDNLSSEANITMNMTTEALLKVSIPMGPDQKPEPCHRFRQTQWQLLDPDVSPSNNTELQTEPCLDGWTYDHSVFTSTIITEWDLVCDYQSFKYLEQAISLAGHLVGIAINVIFGRKPLVVCCCLIYGLLGTCCAVVPTFALFCALRFIMSASVTTLQCTVSILVLEVISLKWYPAVVALFGLTLSTGHALLGGLAYVFRDWHKLQLGIALPFLLVSLFIWWVPESVRWLMATGRTKRAVKELQRIAYFNGKKDVAQSLTIEEELGTVKCMIIIELTECLSVFSHRFSLVFSFFGFMMDIEHFGKDMFLVQFLQGITDFPCKVIAYFIVRHVKRRPSVAFLQFVLGSSILVNIFVPKEHNMHLFIFLVGRASFAALTVTYMAFTNELSPTIIRSTLQSSFGFAQKLSSIFSVLTLKTRDYFVHLPMILCGTIPIVALVFLCYLPETFSHPLLDTIQEMEDKFRNKRPGEKQSKILLETTGC
uniref:Solute carrier family 22 (organic cation transporter), member 22 n=1 Tax=Jaculus jaculus TaxID=51337 RepID=A0A8C5L070_JACJA